MKDKDLRPWLSVIAGGESLVSHAGGVLLVEAARRSGLAKELSGRLGPWRRPLATHDPGKIVLDLAIAVALGGDAACDIAVLRAQPGVFGPVASDPTVSRLIAPSRHRRRRRARGDHRPRGRLARERVWGWSGTRRSRTGGVVIDLDATLLDAHSEKQQASRTWKKGFGFHPLLGFVDHGTGGGGEPVAELLRPGRAGSNTAVDHVTVLDAALAQTPRAAATARRPGPGGGAGTHRRRRRHQGVRPPPRPDRGGVLPGREPGPRRHPWRARGPARGGVDPGLSGAQAPRRRDRRADPTA